MKRVTPQILPMPMIGTYERAGQPQLFVRLLVQQGAGCDELRILVIFTLSVNQVILNFIFGAPDNALHTASA